MTFADPYLFGLLALIPLLLSLRRRRPRDEGSGAYSDLGLLHDYRPGWRLRYRWLPTAVRALALALLVIALARPQTGQAESELPAQGIDIALVLDASSSMGTGFGERSRLGVAQSVLSEFIAGRENDRIGLVVFREAGLVLSPLTLDYVALDALLLSAGDLNIRDGTAIGVGLAEALNLLRESRARSRVIVLLTDGENNSGQVEPLAAARIAEALGVRVYTIGVLDQGGRGSGSVVDERALTEMARITGGRYFQAESAAALEAIYERIDALETSRVGRTQFAAFNELAIYFLAAGLVLLAAELGLRSTLWRRAA